MLLIFCKTQACRPLCWNLGLFASLMGSPAVLSTNPYNQGTTVHQAPKLSVDYIVIEKECQKHHPANSNREGMRTPRQPKQNKTKKHMEKRSEAHKYAGRMK